MTGRKQSLNGNMMCKVVFIHYLIRVSLSAYWLGCSIQYQVNFVQHKARCLFYTAGYV